VLTAFTQRQTSPVTTRLSSSTSEDCDAYVEACPVDACFAEDQVPDEWQKFTVITAEYFRK
jgi:hypothetical protein